MASSKDAVVLDVAGHEVRVSNPEKPYFGDRGIRKIDVVEYFVSVGPGILNALRDRPTTLERWPGGVFEGARISTRVDNTGDPVTPLPGAQDMAKDLENADLLLWQGQGHTSYPKTPCITSAVDNYLINLVPPLDGLTCPAA